MAHMRTFVSNMAIVAALATSQSAVAKTAAAPGDFSGTVVSVGKCAFSTWPAQGAAPAPAGGEKALPALLAASAISKGVSLLAAAATAAGESKTWTVTASRNFQATAGDYPVCVQVVRGPMLLRKDVPQPSLIGDLETARRTLADNGTYLADVPEYFFEGRLVRSQDDTAMTFRPVAAYLGKPIGERALRRDDIRNVAMFFAITAPNSKATVDPSATSAVIVGELQPGVFKHYPDIDAVTSSPLESAWITWTAPKANQPVTITALESETQDGSNFWKFIGSVLGEDSVKSAATTALQGVIPSYAAQAAQTQLTNLVTLENSASAAREDARTKLQSCANAISDYDKASADAAAALRTYADDDAALPDGDSLKMGDITLAVINGPGGIKSGLPAAQQTSACATFLKQHFSTN